MNSQDPFSKWRKDPLKNELINDQTRNESSQATIEPPVDDFDRGNQPAPKNQMEMKPKESDPFLKWKKEFPMEGDNDLDRDIERNVARGTSRIGETIAGAPGDVLSMIKGFIGDLPIGGVLGEFLPTSGKLQEASEKTSLGYTKPQSSGEEKSDEILKDVASFMIPGSNQYSMLRNIGIPLAGSVAKEYAGDGAKTGLMIGLDLMSNRSGMGGGAKKYASSLFQEMEKEVPKGMSISASSLEKHLGDIEKHMSLGGSKPSTEKALSKIKEIKDKVKNGKISLEELVKTRPAINEMIEDLGGFEYMFKPKIKERIVKNLQDVKGAVIKSLDEYGAKFNPKFRELSRNANEAYSAYEKSNKISQFLNKRFGNKALGMTTKSLLGIGIPGAGAGAIGVLGSAAGTGAGVAGYQGFKVLHRVYNSPTLRKYYGNILKGSLSGNASQVSRNLSDLDKNLKEED